MKRFVIIPKRKGNFAIPVIETREFNSPMRFGSYCADDGTLWTTLDDGINIFEDELLANARLKILIRELLGEII